MLLILPKFLNRLRILRAVKDILDSKTTGGLNAQEGLLNQLCSTAGKGRALLAEGYLL
jgi:hypothetical protein